MMTGNRAARLCGSLRVGDSCSAEAGIAFLKTTEPAKAVPKKSRREIGMFSPVSKVLSARADETAGAGWSVSDRHRSARNESYNTTEASQPGVRRPLAVDSCYDRRGTAAGLQCCQSGRESPHVEAGLAPGCCE